MVFDESAVSNKNKSSEFSGCRHHVQLSGHLMAHLQSYSWKLGMEMVVARESVNGAGGRQLLLIAPWP